MSEESLQRVSQEGFLGALVDQIGKNVGINQGTYMDTDGLIHCSNCGGAMQHVLEIDIDYPPDERTDEYIEWQEAGSVLPRKKRMVVPSMCPCRKEKYDAEEARRKKDEEMQRIKSLKTTSLMDEKFASSTFDSYDVTKYNERPHMLCKRYLDKFPEMVEKNQGLLLYGGIGTGKTYTAACIANALMNQLTPVVMTSFVRILQSIQSFKGDDDEDKLMTRLMRPKLLIIDDLGAERSTDYALEKVYNVIDSRYRSRKPMILTTNLTLAEMQEASDIRYARIYDRVFEVCYPIEFKGPSWRKREASVRQREMQKLFEED